MKMIAKTRELMFVLHLLSGFLIGERQTIRLKVITFVDGNSDGYIRFLRSCRVNKLDVRVIGLDNNAIDKNRDDDIDWKLNVLRIALKKFKNKESLVVLVTEAYDSIVQLDNFDILEKFVKFRSQVVLSTINANISDMGDNEYLEENTKISNKRDGYISTKGIIGYAPDLYKMFTYSEKNIDNFQKYITSTYHKKKEEFRIDLDYSGDIFHIVNGNQVQVELEFNGNDVSVIDKRFKTKPAVIIAGTNDEKSMVYLNHLSNYVPKVWSYKGGCITCHENKIYLDYSKNMHPMILIKKEQWPTVLIGIYISFPFSFIDVLLHQVSNLDYPKHKIHIYIHNMIERHDHNVEVWIREIEKYYNSIVFIPSSIYTSEKDGRNLGIFHWRKLKTDFYFSIDGVVSLTKRETLRLLVEQNRGVLVPMLNKDLNLTSNFWGKVATNGSFDTFSDHWEIVNGTRRGLWNSACIKYAYLLNLSILDLLGIDPFLNENENDDAKVIFCANLREKRIFMFVTNMENYGHLKSLVNYKPTHARNDLFELFDNRRDWELKYLHPDHVSYLQKETKQIQQPCRDVYWVPMVTKTFAEDLIDECEAYGKWSDSSNSDKRLGSGNEAVSTINILMEQIGFENHWLHMLEYYFSPIIRRLYLYGSKNEASLNFVVKYTVNGQSRLKPHHDASTYTINMALNERHVDYDGGGTRFIRYNCSVTDTKVGWALFHPGQLTHYHERLPISRGTRYVMVSLVDPN